MTSTGLASLKIPGTLSSPCVDADEAAGVLVLSGESYPENSFEFFRPILTWCADFLARDDRPLTVDLRLTYLNTSSIKAMMDLLDTLEDAHRAGRTVAVRWYYDQENDRALDLAEEFKEDLTLPFHTIPVHFEG